MFGTGETVGISLRIAELGHTALGDTSVELELFGSKQEENINLNLLFPVGNSRFRADTH